MPSRKKLSHVVHQHAVQLPDQVERQMLCPTFEANGAQAVVQGVNITQRYRRIFGKAFVGPRSFVCTP